MAIAAVFEFPGEPVEKYHKVFDAGEAIVTSPAASITSATAPNRLHRHRHLGRRAILRRLRRDPRPSDPPRWPRRQARRSPGRAGHDARRHPIPLAQADREYRWSSSTPQAAAPPARCTSDRDARDPDRPGSLPSAGQHAADQRLPDLVADGPVTAGRRAPFWKPFTAASVLGPKIPSIARFCLRHTNSSCTPRTA